MGADSRPDLTLTATLPYDAESAPLERSHVGRFAVQSVLGAGAMGMVLRGYDPELDRGVAIKLLRPDTWSHAEGRARLQREAQAMAKLSHPNVVAVYDVGTVGDELFIAMELVEGQTLAAWLAEESRTRREILEMFVAAGRGLVAAHAAGLVHRDFKPGNVLVGRDGRPRVGDFGLVSASAPTAAAGDSAPTRTRVTAGTPAYMSPEQFADGPVDARSDQFSFCVALWEALHGERPFEGTTLEELRQSVTAGRRRPARREVPAWIAAVLDRGLAVEPDARWPSLAALLDALARDPAARRRRILVAASIAMLGGVAVFALWRGRADAPDPCAGADERLAGVWDETQRSVLRDHLAAVDRAEGATRFAAAAAVLDRRAREWTAMHVEACRATRVIGHQSESAYELRMRCLDRRLAELDSSAKLLAATSDPASLDQAMPAAIALEPLAPCADVTTLERTVPLPREPARRAEAEAIARDVDAIEIERRAGHLKDLRARIDPVVARARALDHAPTLAIALASLGELEHSAGEIAAATVTYRQLAEVAARARDDARETTAWATLVTALGVDLGKPDEARALIPVARAALARAGDRVDLRITVLHAEAGFLDAHGEAAQARARLEEARGLIEKQGALEAGSPLMPRLADLWLEIGDARRDADPDGAAAAYRRAIELWERSYGPGHADVAWGWHNLGALLADQAKIDDALSAIRKAIAIREARLGDTPLLALSLGAEATTLYYGERYQAALASARRALAIYQRSADPDSLESAGVRLTVAMADSALGREPEARAAYDELIALFDRTGAKTANLIVALFRRGEQAAKLGKCGEAVSDYERAERVAVELEGDRTGKLVYPLVGRGGCLVRLHRPAEAVPILRRAVALKPSPSEDALARFLLGRALFESHDDPGGGLAMARAARTQMNSRDPEFKQATAEAQAWLDRI